MMKSNVPQRLVFIIFTFCFVSCLSQLRIMSLFLGVPHAVFAEDKESFEAAVTRSNLFPEHVTKPDLAGASKGILIGLDADMSSGSAESGEAIRRGIALAMTELNQKGGVLGRPFKLVVRDNRGNPGRGRDNIDELARMPNLVAVVGGIHTPVALKELELLHQHQLIYLAAWSAGTPIIDNGYKPNYAFRVSVRDEYAGEFLVNEAIRMGYKRPGLLLEQTGWGKSNERAIVSALQKRNLMPAGIEWFHWGISDMQDLIEILGKAGADTVMLVANPPEGMVAVRSMAALPPVQRLPIISHWGITGSGKRFFHSVRDDLSKVDLVFLQTFSFIDPPFPGRAHRVFEAYQAIFPSALSPRDVFSPVGTAHAYELIHLLKLAIEKAGTIERPAVQKALEHLGPYTGLIRHYNPPFTTDRHDALTAEDFRLARYADDGAIIPLPKVP